MQNHPGAIPSIPRTSTNTPTRAAILDARGQPLFKLKKQLLSIHSTYIGYSPTTKEPIFTVKSSFSFGTKLTATFRNVAGDGREMELVLRGNILDRSAEITTAQGVPVARISRSFANAGEVLCAYSLSSFSGFRAYIFIPSL
jgi:uncharacterized protein YxjI